VNENLELGKFNNQGTNQVYWVTIKQILEENKGSWFNKEWEFLQKV